ncbi:hypothetical protein DL770_009825 [Monosporascus sp. CRB-9-2]|nr:hypothetical protein DL770_009825 [Monosporascus sp. CRB-9-2]
MKRQEKQTNSSKGLCKQELKDSGRGIAKERRAIEKQRELEEARSGTPSFTITTPSLSFSYPFTIAIAATTTIYCPCSCSCAATTPAIVVVFIVIIIAVTVTTGAITATVATIPTIIFVFTVVITGRGSYTEQVNLARAGSQHFLTETFHLYVEDARIQLRWQRAPEGVAPRPILLGAIENGIPVGNIRQIVEAYTNVYAQSIDQIWGVIHSSHSPPLHVAIQNGRHDVVEMLFQLGANPDIRYWSYQDWPNGLRCALRHAGNHAWYSDVHRGIENSLLALMRRGYSFDVFTGGLDPRISEDCSTALRANLANTVRTVLDDISLRPSDNQQRRSLQQMPLTLLYAVCSYGQDGKEALIAWFFQHDIALRGPVNVVEAVVEQEKHRNAAFLLREQIRQDMFSHYDVGYIFAIAIWDQHLGLTRAIVEALDHSAQMGRVLTSQRDGMRYTPGQVLSILLQNAARWDAPETVKWLLEIGAVWAPDSKEFGPDPLVMAIRFGYRRVITMLMEDASPHIRDRYPDVNCLVQGRTALDWAIRARRFGVLAYVLSRGPNRDVLPLETRVEACRWYRDVFGRPYNVPDYEWVVNHRNLASTAFLPDTRISDRRRSAMFRHILGTFRLSVV